MYICNLLHICQLDTILHIQINIHILLGPCSYASAHSIVWQNAALARYTVILIQIRCAKFSGLKLENLSPANRDQNIICRAHTFPDT